MKPQLNRVAWYLSGENWGFVIYKQIYIMVKLILNGIDETSCFEGGKYKTIERVYIDVYTKLIDELEKHSIPVYILTEYKYNNPDGEYMWRFTGHDKKNNIYFYEFETSII